MTPLPLQFFDQPPLDLATALLGKVFHVKHEDCWLKVGIIETEAYLLSEKASHSSKGFTEKRKAMFMAAGTIYMYYSRGADSLNISAQGEGNAVLIKSGTPFPFDEPDSNMIEMMQILNPHKNRPEPREPYSLASGQTLLCRSLNLKVKDWNQKQFDPERFFITDVGYQPETIIATTRLGITPGRDEHLPYRFIDEKFVKYCTKKP